MQVDQRIATSYFATGEYIRLPGMGEPLQGVVWSRIPKGIPKMLTIRRNASGQWFVSFMTEEVIEPHPMVRQITGIDLGLKRTV